MMIMIITVVGLITYAFTLYPQHGREEAVTL